MEEESFEDDECNLQQQQADALVEVARGYLAGDSDKKQSTADHYQIMEHVDENALRGVPDENSQSDLPIETVRRLCCDGSLVAVTKDEHNNPLHVGRKHRVVQGALRRALIARDKCCRYPDCTHEKWLDAQSLPRFIGYHVVHWVDGGETSLDNAILLCSKHHRLLHDGRFEIKPGPAGDWLFRSSG